MGLFSHSPSDKCLFILFPEVLLLGSLFLGGCTPRHEEPPLREKPPLVAVPVYPHVTIPGKTRELRPQTLRPLNPPTPTLEPIPGMGSGKPFSTRDIPGRDLSLPELASTLNGPAPKEKNILTSRDLGVFGEVADSVQDFRDSLEESTLQEGSKALNALPFVYAEPDEAKVDYSGGTFSIGISIPVERLRIGTPLDPESPESKNEASSQ